MSTKRKASVDHFNSLTDAQQRKIIDSLNLDIDLDFIIKSTSSREAKITFSDTLFYPTPSQTKIIQNVKIDGTTQKYTCSYEDLVDLIDHVLRTRYEPTKNKDADFKIAQMPTGTLIFGMGHTKKENLDINDDKTWNEFKSRFSILENYETKRRKINSKLNSCKVRLAVIVKPRNTSKSPTSKSSSPGNKKNQFKFPKVMKIDIVSPCTKKEDKQNHTITYLTGSINVLSSFSHDLSIFFIRNRWR